MCNDLVLAERPFTVEDAADLKAHQGHIVYLLQCKNDALYTGYTTCLGRRLLQHLQGKGAKYVRSQLPFKLVAAYACPSKSSALKLEYRIKQKRRTDKLELVGTFTQLTEENVEEI